MNGLKPIQYTTPDDVKAIKANPKHRAELHDRVGRIHLAEWLAHSGDRHGGNYALHPDHGLISIDNAEAFHPDNQDWREITATPEPYKDHDFGFGDAGPHWSQPHTADGALPLFLSNLGISPAEQRSIRIPPDAIRSVLNRADDLVTAARHGTEGLHPEQRQIAQRAMRHRLSFLRDYFNNAGGSIDLAKFHSMIHHAAAHAETHRADLIRQAKAEAI